MSGRSSSPHLFSLGGIKLHLQGLLDNSEKQRQQAGLLWQRVLTQQVELEGRVRQIEELCSREDEADELDANPVERYQELIASVSSWEVEISELLNGFGTLEPSRVTTGKEPPRLASFSPVHREGSRPRTQDVVSGAEHEKAETRYSTPISPVPLSSPLVPKTRNAASSVHLLEIPPPAQSSPPSPELIRSAMTPTPMSASGCNGCSSVPPSRQSRSYPSNSSLQSVTETQCRAFSIGTTSSSGVGSQNGGGISTTSLTLNNDLPSPRILSMNPSSTLFDPLYTPDKAGDLLAHNATDHRIVHAIAKIMTGEFMYKYKRRLVGSGISENRHRRFFWVHPYTKTLYWSLIDPGSPDASQSNAEGVRIMGVRSVLDPNPRPPGLSQYSIVVSTRHRELKLTAPRRTTHDIWMSALNFLLSRPVPDILPLDEAVHSRIFTTAGKFPDEQYSSQSHSQSSLIRESAWPGHPCL